MSGMRIDLIKNRKKIYINYDSMNLNYNSMIFYENKLWLYEHKLWFYHIHSYSICWIKSCYFDHFWDEEMEVSLIDHPSIWSTSITMEIPNGDWPQLVPKVLTGAKEQPHCGIDHHDDLRAPGRPRMNLSQGNQWIGGTIYRKPSILPLNIGFSYRISHKPIHWGKETGDSLNHQQ